MAALEAAACGVPVVGTRVGLVPELTGASVRVGDAEALAHAITATLAQPAAGDATRRVRSEFSLPRCTDRFRQLYATLRAAQPL